MTDENKGYKNLIAWQKGMYLAEIVYSVTSDFPKEELFGLASQMRRSSVSIPSNIAEGQLRDSKKEFKHFVSIALGSCAELSTQLELASRLKYMTDTNFRSLSQLIDEEMKILHGIRRKFSKL